MKKENWEFLKFCLKLGVKFTPRMMVAPYVGAVRGVWAVQDKIDAEITAFCEAERKAQRDAIPSEQVVGQR
jgi:hypothetical protein